MKLNEINIRDPFVLPVDGKYYMYGTRGSKNFGEASGFDVFVSEDLENWSEPHEVFAASEEFWADQNFWAPRCTFITASIICSPVSRQTAFAVARRRWWPIRPWGRSFR